MIIDNRSNNIELSVKQVRDICDRRFGGADGLMLLNSKEGYDFEMKYYNADGGERHVRQWWKMRKFGSRHGYSSDKLSFYCRRRAARCGNTGQWLVHLKMKDVYGFKKRFRYGSRYGLSHYVKPVVDVKDYDVVEKGREIRYSNDFAKEGINVNFVEAISRGIYVENL